MKTAFRYLLVAAATAVAAPTIAAPFTPAERTVVEKRERHDFRDVQVNDFRTHGSLSKEARDAFASAKSTAKPAPMVEPGFVFDRLTAPY